MSALIHQFPRIGGATYPRHYRVEDGFAPPFTSPIARPVSPQPAHWPASAPVFADDFGDDIASFDPGFARQGFGAYGYDDPGARPQGFATPVAQPPRAPRAAPAQFVAHPAQPWGAVPPSPAPAPRRDPSPSRLAYKLSRLWLTPVFRSAIKFGLPLLLLVSVVAMFLSDAERRAGLATMASELWQEFENRPEFMVTQMTVNTESQELAQGIVQRLGLEFPVSSFRLDMDALRAQVEALDAVESAAIRIRSGGVIEVSATERDPAIIWRSTAGLELLDTEGRRVARLTDRAARPDLPIIAGDGAPAAIAEAWTLLQAARPLGGQLRGLVRVGERRWDVLLEGDQRILLPANGALPALERVLALNTSYDLLSRDITHVDMRNPVRPTLRLSPEAALELARIRSLQTGALSR
jgi:cell division protein FtsQ